MRAAEQDRPDVARKRARWKTHQGRIDASRLVFIDETWIKTNMAPLRGWGSKGDRLRGFTPHGHWQTLTFLGALRCDRLTAPCVFDGPINGECFRAYVEQFLAPTLGSGDIVIADNLSSHKVAGVREAIQAREASLLFLPGYSPDLNPIEQGFSKLKALIRKAAPRTREALWQQTGSIILDFTPTECANFLANAGYRQSA